MLGFSALHPGPPHPKRRGFHFLPHHLDYLLLTQAKLGFDRVERCTVFPSHFNNTVEIDLGKQRLICVHTLINYNYHH